MLMWAIFFQMEKPFIAVTSVTGTAHFRKEPIYHQRVWTTNTWGLRLGKKLLWIRIKASSSKDSKELENKKKYYIFGLFYNSMKYVL